jgi:hypothetical protein
MTAAKTPTLIDIHRNVIESSFFSCFSSVVNLFSKARGFVNKGDTDTVGSDDDGLAEESQQSKARHEPPSQVVSSGFSFRTLEPRQFVNVSHFGLGRQQSLNSHVGFGQKVFSLSGIP